MILRILTYFSVWDFTRWFRLAAAILMFSVAAIDWQILPLIIGGIFLYQSITNTGCCSSGNCEIPSSQKLKNKN